MEFDNMKKGISIIHILLMVVLLIMNIMILIDNHAVMAMKVCTALCIVTIVFSSLYVLGGSGKNVAKYYKLFTIAFVATEFVAFVGVAYVNDDLTRILVSAIILALIIILAIGKDYGKELSLTICVLLIIVSCIKTIYCIYNFPATHIDNTVLTRLVWMHNISSSVLSFLPLVMTIEKYIDKSKRGSN